MILYVGPGTPMLEIRFSWRLAALLLVVAAALLSLLIFAVRAKLKKSRNS